jgi:hypothetical protein
MTTTDHLMDFLAGQLADIETGWSVGTFGAIAEFTRDPGEPAELRQNCDTISVVTSRGGLRIMPRPGLRPIATESPTTESWSHRVALCLPHEACAMVVHCVAGIAIVFCSISVSAACKSTLAFVATTRMLSPRFEAGSENRCLHPEMMRCE